MAGDHLGRVHRRSVHASRVQPDQPQHLQLRPDRRRRRLLVCGIYWLVSARKWFPRSEAARRRGAVEGDRGGVPPCRGGAGRGGLSKCVTTAGRRAAADARLGCRLAGADSDRTAPAGRTPGPGARGRTGSRARACVRGLPHGTSIWPKGPRPQAPACDPWARGRRCRRRRRSGLHPVRRG